MVDEKDFLLKAFDKALDSVNPYTLICRSCRLEGEQLLIRNQLGQEQSYSLKGVKKIVLMAAGKAAVTMAKGMEEVLGDRIHKGIVITKEGHLLKGLKSPVWEASHPIPDERSVAAAKALMSLADQCDRDTLVLFLISGGASALLALPYEDDEIQLTLEDLQGTTQAFLRCGAPIEDINRVRKHLSLIKGGQLARKIFPGQCLSLLLSDVISNDLSLIGSGPTVPDDSTFSQAWDLVKKYDLNLPLQVQRLLQKGAAGEIPDTPGSNDPCFARTSNLLLGTNYLAASTAEAYARSQGWPVLFLTSYLRGEASSVAGYFHALAQSIKELHKPVKPPVLLIAGGETTVTIRGKGLGGRNQEMALSFLQELGQYPLEGIYFLSGATDGNDGPTDAAGGLVAYEDWIKGLELGVPVGEALKANDSYHALEKLDCLIKTGPTNTNVCDIQMCLIL